MDFEAAKAAFGAGLRAQQAARWADAEGHYRASLAALPGRPSTLINLAAVLLAGRRADEALPLLQQALEAEPDSADAWFQLAEAQAQRNRLPEALASLERLLAIDDTVGPAWSRRGALLKDMGRPAEAISALQRAVALGADVAVNRWLLAGLRGDERPPQPPPGFVQALFDSYAADFDEHLVERLHYRVPELLLQGLPRTAFGAALDLGCGTGLAGRLLRPLVAMLEGVDVSAEMLARARDTHVYDALHQDEITGHLASTAQRFDLLVAADVFIYIGELTSVFSGMRRVLRPGGVAAFSVELADDAVDYTLLPCSRYAQSEPYLRRLAAEQGFTVHRAWRDTLRLDQRQPVPGLLMVLRTP